MLKKAKRVPTINVMFSDGTHKQWKKYSESKLIKELTVLLTEKTKNLGRANGEMRIVYERDPDGDFYTRFSFINLEDCLYKLKPAIEPALLRFFYETTS